MGGGTYDPVDYKKAVDNLKATGQTFARSTQAAATGNISGSIAEILDPRKLKNGMRESCFAPGFNDALAIIVSIDGTGSMSQVPRDLQKELPNLMTLLLEKGISDHPNVMFMMHDDENCYPQAAFQMSQFEVGAPELIEALNNVVIPGAGGGNRGEAYHIPIYAAANHTRLEAFERDGTKGLFFLIGDEEPYYEAGDPTKRGTSLETAEELFGDKLEREVTMLESMKKLCERYYVFVLRPGHTSHGKEKKITKMWQDLLSAAGENPEHVLEVPETDALISTMAMAIGRLHGIDQDDLVQVLRTKGASGVDSAAAVTSSLVPVAAAAMASSQASGALATSDSTSSGRARS